MAGEDSIPAFGLYGEDHPFPDVMHHEAFSARAPIHDWRIVPHRHTQMTQLFVIRDGRVRARVDDHHWDFSGGSYLTCRNIACTSSTLNPAPKGSVFSFPVSVVQAIGPNGQAVRTVLARPLAGGISPAFGQLLAQLKAAATGEGPFRSQLAVALSHAVLVFIAEEQRRSHAPEDAADSARLSQLDGLITAHAAKGWSARDYARALSVSTGHLSRLCRASTGRGASAYIERRIIDEACRLLAFTQLPVSEIGYRLGFADPSYFSKRFSKARGQSPTAYRARFTQ